jgi:hypothetical protein
VILSRRVENILHFILLTLRPVLVHGTGIIVNGPVDREKGQRDDGFLVDDVKFLADGRDGETSAGGEDRRLGGDAVARQCVEDAGSCVLGVLLRRLRCILWTGEGGAESCDRWGSGADREGWSGPGGACSGLVSESMGVVSVSSCCDVPMALLARREAIVSVCRE